MNSVMHAEDELLDRGVLAQGRVHEGVVAHAVGEPLEVAIVEIVEGLLRVGRAALIYAVQLGAHMQSEFLLLGGDLVLVALHELSKILPIFFL